MTALFCEPHPLTEYRTDFSIDSNHLFIPSGETRTITINSPANPRGGLKFIQTGWRVSCWNADDITFQPSKDVALSVGRRDAMCREYDGYQDASVETASSVIELEGNRIDGGKIPYILGKKVTAVKFVFCIGIEDSGRSSRLRIHTSDQERYVVTNIIVKLNGNTFSSNLPKGLGIQEADPAHLAFPYSLEITLPAGMLKERDVLEVSIEDGGWFTWDAADLVLV